MKKNLILAVTLLLMSVTTINAQGNKGIKYQGDYYLGYGVNLNNDQYSNLYLQTVQGLRFSDYFSAGIGVGFTMFDVADALYLIPITINTKGYIPINEKNEIFISLDMGVVCAPDEAMKAGSFGITPAVGITFCDNFSASIGYDVIFPNLSALVFKFGYTY